MENERATDTLVQELPADPWLGQSPSHAAPVPASHVSPVSPSPPVPPVRTIVLDRPPVPVAPPREREAVRERLGGAGPERLTLRDVSIHYGADRRSTNRSGQTARSLKGQHAVNGVSLSIHQGEVLALIGPSGCGKTSLLRALNRLTELTPSAARGGEILLDGRDVHTLPDTQLRARVAMVFQQPNPFPMSIFDNVAFALREQSRKRPRRRELEPLVIDALQRAGLYEEVRDDLDRPALRLSGGQQQRLCIARAIAMRPEVLLMDEPCSALDPISTGVIEELIGELRRELAVVIVTHNLAQARRVADKVAFMYLGDLVEYGTVEQVFEHPRAERTREYVRGAFG
jgi:phosphate transport system ATP-binding protein